MLRSNAVEREQSHGPPRPTDSGLRRGREHFEIYGVARKTIYKWLERHDAVGMAGLADRSRAPQHTPHKLSEDVIAEIIAARQRWNWGRENCASNSPPRSRRSGGRRKAPSAKF